MNKNRLQFVHHNEVFASREEAIAYVKSSQTIDRPSLYAEPMVLKYGNATEPNVILAIGSVGDGSINASNKTFFIDVKGIEENVDALDEKIEGLAEALSLSALDSDTIDLEASWGEDGIIMSGDVKLNNTVVINRKEVDSIIKKDENGLYAYVNLTFDDETNTFNFQVNNSETEFSIPVIESAVYDVATESIIFTYTNGSTISVSMDKVIEEWTVDGAPVSTITLHRDRQHTQDEETHKWKDVLWGEVNIAPSGITSDNILKKTSDNKYLYVDGKADNISYWKNGEKITVKRALDEIETKVSPNEANIISKKYDSRGEEEGVFASVSMSYDEASNKLSLITSTVDGGNKTTTFQLNAASFIDDISYNSVTEVLTIRYVDQNGNIQSIDIELKDIIDEWVVNNDSHTVELVKQHNTPGKDVLSADVKIASKTSVPTNILEVSDHMLVVRGEASNIKYTNSETVGDALDRIADEKAEIDSKINAISGAVEDNDFSVEETDTIVMSKESVPNAQDVVSADVKISDIENNIILSNANGVYATISYNPGTNTISVSDTSKSGAASVIREIPLSADTNMSYEGYDAETEEIILSYKTAAHPEHELRIPVRNIINEIDVESEGYTVNLSITRNVDGKDILTADVNITTEHDDNILEVVNENGHKALYVSGRAIDELEERADLLNIEVDEIRDDTNELFETTSEIGTALSAETTARENADSALDSRTSAVEHDIDVIMGSIPTVQSAISDEVIRATSAETALNTSIEAETTARENADSTLQTALETEIANREHADDDLKNLIDAVSGKVDDEKVTVANTTTLELNKSSENVITGNVKLSAEAGNIINAANGLYVNVDLEYNDGTNVLKLITSENEKEIQLSVGSIVDSITYDPVEHNLVLTYTNAQGETHQITVGVEDLFNDVGVLEHAHPGGILLHKYKTDAGEMEISATTMILDSLDTNILNIRYADQDGKIGYLYVDGVADNIKMNDGTNNTVADALNEKADADNVYTKAEIDEMIPDPGEINQLREDVDALSGEVSAMTSAIEGKADASDLEALAGDVNAISGEVSALTVVVQDKADASDLEALANDVTTLSGEVSALTVVVQDKADASDLEALAGDVNAISGEVSAMTSIIEGKADASDLEALANTVADKADSTVVEELSGKTITGITVNGDDVTIQDNVAEIVITIDSALDTGSTNPIENAVVAETFDSISGTIIDNEKVIAGAFNDINDRLVVIEGSYVPSGDFATINGQVITNGGDIVVGGSGTIDDHLSDTSENPVQNKVVTNAINGKADAADLNSKFGAVQYVDNDKKIYFYSGNTGETAIGEIDATDFIVDGMVENVEISGNPSNLVITFNTDSGKQPIAIPLSNIFDPSNYYTSTEIDNLLGTGITTSHTVTSEINSLLDQIGDVDKASIKKIGLTDTGTTVSADTNNIAVIPSATTSDFGLVKVENNFVLGVTESVNPASTRALNRGISGLISGVSLNNNAVTVDNRVANITVDSTPTSGSTNPIQSNAVWELQDIINRLETVCGELRNEVNDLKDELAEVRSGYTYNSQAVNEP